MNTPIDVCESRDVNGLYRRARAGEIREMTGVDDPYEPPEAPEIVIDTVGHPPVDAASRILEVRD